MPKDIIDAILDRVIDSDALVEEALAAAERQRATIRAALRKVMAMQGDVTQKREAWVAAFRELVLATYAPLLPACLALVKSSLKAEARAVRAVGGAHRVKEIPALRKADLMRRRAERKAVTDGETPPAQ